MPLESTLLRPGIESKIINKPSLRLVRWDSVRGPICPELLKKKKKNRCYWKSSTLRLRTWWYLSWSLPSFPRNVSTHGTERISTELSPDRPLRRRLSLRLPIFLPLAPRFESKNPRKNLPLSFATPRASWKIGRPIFQESLSLSLSLSFSFFSCSKTKYRGRKGLAPQSPSRFGLLCSRHRAVEPRGGWSRIDFRD